MKQIAWWVLHSSTFLATCLVFDDHVRLKEHFHWLVPQTVVTQVAGQILYYAMIEQIFAPSYEALRNLKEELNCTFRNGFCNLSRLAWRCETSCTKNCKCHSALRASLSQLTWHRRSKFATVFVRVFAHRFRKFRLNGSFTSADSCTAECRILGAQKSWWASFLSS